MPQRGPISRSVFISLTRDGSKYQADLTVVRSLDVSLIAIFAYVGTAQDLGDWNRNVSISRRIINRIGIPILASSLRMLHCCRP